MSTLAIYRQLLARARRLCRSHDMAVDLLHDALRIALESGREPLSDPDDTRWLVGVLRKQVLMQARTDIRRRQRESAWAASNEAETSASVEEGGCVGALLAAMPPAARQVAVLALHGLDEPEIRWLLEVSDTAFRQRLTSIRKALKHFPGELRGEAMALALRRRADTALDYGLIRRALLAEVRRSPGVGSHDPDGHLLVFRDTRAHKPGHRGN